MDVVSTFACGTNTLLTAQPPRPYARTLCIGPTGCVFRGGYKRERRHQLGGAANRKQTIWGSLLFKSFAPCVRFVYGVVACVGIILDFYFLVSPRMCVCVFVYPVCCWEVSLRL